MLRYVVFLVANEKDVSKLAKI